MYCVLSLKFANNIIMCRVMSDSPVTHTYMIDFPLVKVTLLAIVRSWINLQWQITTYMYVMKDTQMAL